MKLKLTDLGIKSLPIPAKGQTDYYDTTYPGLCVRVSQGGSKVFTLIHRKNGARKRYTLGTYGEISLSEARTLARRLQIVPPPNSPSLTFYEAVHSYLATEGQNMSARHRAEVERIFQKQFTDLHKKALAEVDTGHITAIIDRMTPSVANHAYVRAKTFLNWCRRRKLIPSNPLEDMKIPYKTQSRERILTDEELRRIWHACLQLGTFGRIVQMLLLTGCRRSEIANLRREWVQGDLLVIPKEHTKGRREHIIPLPSFSHSLMATLPTQSPFVFSAREKTETPFNGWGQSKSKLDKLSGISDWRLHDLRRTFRTKLSEWKCCDSDTAERLIGHKVGSEVSRIYDRYDRLEEKREAVAKYERRLKAVLNLPT
jgi:integrase